jgi:KaiC/GvpD/RAD55 family RecA-like ATPase
MTQRNRENLGYLGEEFQYKLVHEFIGNHVFFEDLNCIIDQNMFTDPNLKTIVGVMKNYHEKYETVPDYDLIGIELRNLSHSDKEVETYLAVLDKIKGICPSGVESIRDKAEKFFRQQNIVRTANEILKVAERGNDDQYDRCVSLLNDAMAAGIHNDFGEKPFDHINETLSDDYRIPIPTGIGKIDETLEGGLGKGELGVIIGPSGFGKSSMTTAMASHAACKGFKVLQIVFEDRVKQIQRKHLGRITGIEAKDLSKPDNIELVRKTLESFPDKDKLNENLRIVKFPSGEKTALDIKRFIQRITNTGFKPDLVIVDYFECLAHEPSRDSANEYEKEGKTMRQFEAMAGELDIAMWIPSQGTKDSINLELVTMDKIGGSVKKAQIAHIILSIARTIEDIEENKATIAILKNRAGKSGRVFQNVEFNNGTCRINTDNVDELDSMYEFKKKRDDDLLETQKKIMKRQVDEMQGK